MSIINKADLVNLHQRWELDLWNGCIGPFVDFEVRKYTLNAEDNIVRVIGRAGRW